MPTRRNGPVSSNVRLHQLLVPLLSTQLSPGKDHLKITVLLLAAAALISGCDLHKEERLSEQQKLGAATAQVERLRSQVEDFDRSITKLEVEIKEVREDVKTNDSEYEKNKLELAKYSMEHKMAATAAAVGAAGVAALFSDLGQEQKSAIAVPTAIAVGYCLFNGDECAEVSARIAYYGTQIAVFKSKVNDGQKRENTARGKLSNIESSRQGLKSQLVDLGARASSIRERVQSLQCKFPVCL